MKKVAIMGASGYVGAELTRLLLGHPEVEISGVSSVSHTGRPLYELYPSFYGQTNLVLREPDEILEECDVLFAALPHGHSEEAAQKARDNGKTFIDMGADFRLTHEGDYMTWYGKGFKNPDLHAEAVYGLPECNRDALREAKLIANPGCYPTSAVLGIYPALANGLCDPSQGIIIDSKSGVTGAGKNPAPNTHFVTVNEGFAPYKIASHRHLPEIEQVLSEIKGSPVKVVFTPHLLPVNRGIESTIYIKKADRSLSLIHDTYVNVYKNEPFVKVLPAGFTAGIKHVQYSNYCHISLHEDIHTGMLIIVSVIDNMVKGAAGQAVQNMNLACGFAETAGLTAVAPAF